MTSPAPSERTDRRRRTETKIWLLTSLTVVGAALLWIADARLLHEPSTSVRLPWLGLVAAFAVVEVFVVHVQFRREAFTFSLSEAPVVLGLVFASPAELLSAHLLGSALALAVHRRQRPLKLAFNVGHFALETTLAIGVFHALVDSAAPLAPSSWPAYFAATGAAVALNVLLILSAVTLAEGSLQIDKLVATTVFAVTVAMTNTSIALAAAMVIAVDPVAAVLLVIPATTLIAAYRAYASERRNHESLEFLYESAQAIQRDPELESALVTLLSHTCRMFKADVAELVLLGEGDASGGYRTSVASDGDVEVMRPIELPSDHPLWRTLVVATNTLIAPEHTDDDAVAEYLRRSSTQVAMVSPLRGESKVLGLLLVGNRTQRITGFTRQDLQLLETLATQAAASLENERLETSLAQLTELKHQLSHQAHHDPLTGLANRARLLDEIEATRDDGTAASLLFIDLDDFKTVNDSLGHSAGDRLIAEVAHRLRACVRPADLVSRLGGDEFAILAPASEHEAMRVAERCLLTLRHPFSLDGHQVRIRASIGLAVIDPHLSAEEVLRDADVAMYTAKSRGKDAIERFFPDMRTAVIERHALLAALERATELGEFEMHYQPIVRLSDDRPVGIEALLRWRSPDRGLVSPDRFLEDAETANLTIPIGRAALTQAVHAFRHVQQCFGASSPEFLTVNLSARQLADPLLVDHVANLLTVTGVNPHSLVLEITETVMMSDLEANLTKLHDLQALGVRLALDDFGTGYSSLSYLREFPIHVLKMAKPFVDGALSSGPGDLGFIRTIVQLGHALDLQVVAEGIEHADQGRALLALGCDLGQGYHYARPLSAGDLELYLATATPVVGEEFAPKRRTPLPPPAPSPLGAGRFGREGVGEHPDT